MGPRPGCGSFFGFILAALGDAGNRNHDLAGCRVEDAHATGRTGPEADSVDRHADRLAGRGGQHDLVVAFDREAGDQLPPPGLYDRILREIEKPLLEIALDATGGNQLRCADLLGINRNTLRKKLTDLNIEVTRRRKLM